MQVISSGVTTVTAGNYYSIALMQDGGVWAMGKNSAGQHGDGTLSSKSDFVQVGSTK